MGLMCYFIAARRRVFAVFVTHSPVKWFFFRRQAHAQRAVEVFMKKGAAG